MSSVIFACVGIFFVIIFQPMEDEFLTTKEAAEELKVSAAYIRQLIIAGSIQGAKKFGRDNAVPRSEVERLKNEDRKAGRPSKTKEDEALKENPASGLERQN